MSEMLRMNLCWNDDSTPQEPGHFTRHGGWVDVIAVMATLMGGRILAQVVERYPHGMMLPPVLVYSIDFQWPDWTPA